MKTRVTITIEEELLKEVEKLAKNESRSVSGQISKIIIDFFTSQSQK